MSIVAQAVAGAFASLQAVSGEAVTYCAGSDEVSLVAVPGRSGFQQANDSGITEIQSQDWLILAAELKRNDQPFLPRRGHLIKDQSGRYWKALSDGNEPPFRFNDQFRIVLRVHTKLVEEDGDV